MTYKRDDGSYSAFGQRDREGSTWYEPFFISADLFSFLFQM